ncbi:LuxR C-terminal-related transcriptional regulator [Cellulomonas sp. 179-A 4D5 NHS]|uniref:LuxR C-terminal-related transcriptional regulator n=1 Tax=Cellulomonas sp. 179-A 4D5 NHS TaxID=3142378 RepID=UPI00399F9344
MRTGSGTGRARTPGTTDLQRAGRQGATSRPRLERLLDAWLTVPVVHLEGPPGSGKSALVSRWTQGALDGGAIHGAHLVRPVGSGGVPSPVRSPGLRTSAPGPVVYVIDHPAPTGDGRARELVDLACRDPHRVHVVVMSRGPLTALLGTGPTRDRVQVLTAAEIALTAPEATEIARERCPRATARDVRELLEVTQGWVGLFAGGVRELGTLRDATAGDLARVLARGPTGAHLLEETVASLSDESRATVLALSAARSFDAADAAALTGLPEPDLSALLGAGLVTVDVGAGLGAGRAPRWRVHPVLQRHLDDLAQSGAPGGVLVAEAHARAARHFAQLGRPVHAVDHALAARDADVITRTVVELGPAVIALGHGDRLTPSRLLLPESTRAENPSLLAVEALRLRAAGDIEGALQVGQAAVERSPSPTGGGPSRGTARLQADLALLDLWAARHGWVDPTSAVRTATLLLDSASFEVHPELSLARRAWLAVELGAVLLWTEAVGEAALHLERAASLVAGTDYVHIRASALASRAVAELIDGALQAAASTAEECLALAAPPGSHALYVARADVAAAWVAFERLEPDLARRHLDAAERRDADDRDPLVQVLGQLLRARLWAQEGSFDEAWRVLAGRSVLRRDLPPFLARFVHVVAAEVHVAQQNVTGVRAEVHALRELGQEQDADVFDGVVAMFAGDLVGARRTFESLTARPTRHPVTGTAAAACLVLLTASTQPDDVERPLRDLLSRVWSTGAVHRLTIAAAAGPAFTEALRREADDPHGHPYAQHALAALQRAGHAPESAEPRSVEPAGGALTRRELAVLRGLAEGLSYTEVAHTLFITPNTVKTHVSSLYRKLGVERSAQALRAARQLGMLPPGG